MKNIKILAYAALIASVSTPLKPVKITLKKRLTKETPELYEILKTKQVIENYKTKSGPLTNQEKTAFNNYYKSLLKSLINDKGVRSVLLEIEQKTITNPEAYRLYWDLVIKRLSAVTTQDNAHIVKNAFAQLKESTLKWTLRYIYYTKTNNRIDENDLIEDLFGQFQNINNGKLELYNLNKPHQLTSFLLHSSKIIEPLCGKVIQELDLGSNKLTTVNLSDLPPNLKILDLQDNQLATVNLSDLPPKLETLDLQNNQLTTVDLSDLPNIKYIDLRDNKLTTINLEKFPEGAYIDARDNKFSQNTIKKLEKIAKEKKINYCLD